MDGMRVTGYWKACFVEGGEHGLLGQCRAVLAQHRGQRRILAH
jgi:hypothetical protein